MSRAASASYLSTYIYSNLHEPSFGVTLLVDIFAKEPGVADATYQYATRAISTYSAGIAPNGVEVGWYRTKPDGGLADDVRASVRLVNVEELSDLLNTYYLTNDEIHIHAHIAGPEGSYNASYKVPLFKGFITNAYFDHQTLTIEAVSATSKDLTEFPKRRINPKDHPYAPIAEMGKLIPVVFGNVNLFRKAWCRMPCVDYAQGLYAFDLKAPQPSTDVYVRYPQAKKLAKLNHTLTYTSDGYLQIDDVKRSLSLITLAPMGTNTAAEWYKIRTETFAETNDWVPVVSGDALHVYLEALPNLGNVTAATLQIHINGYVSDYDWTLKQNGTTKASDTGLALNTSEDILSAITWTGDWGVFSLEIDINTATGDQGYVAKIQIDLEFDETISGGDFGSYEVFARSQGRPLNQNNLLVDGTYTFSQSVHPIAQLDHMLRAKDLMGLPVARRDLTSMNQANSDLTTISHDNSDFVLSEVVDPKNWLDDYAFFWALHMFPSYDGAWHFKVRFQSLLSADPVGYLHYGQIAVKGGNANTGEVSAWDSDFAVRYRQVTDVITDVFVRYGYNPVDDGYKWSESLTARYVVSGTADAVAYTNILSDATASFITDNLTTAHVVGMVEDDEAIIGVYPITSIDSETQITVGGTPGDMSGHDYFIGPDLDSIMLEARRRYQADVTLGRQESTLTKVGGYTVPYCQNASPATYFTQYVRDFMSQAWCIVELATFWNATDLEPGDQILLTHPLLPPSLDKRQVATLDGAVSDAATTFTVDAGHDIYPGMFLALDDEIVEVSGTIGDTAVVVTRTKARTLAAAHADNTVVYAFPQQWEVQGVKYDLFKGQIRLILQQLPSYLPDEITIEWNKSIAGTFAVDTTYIIPTGSTLTLT